MLRIKKSCLKAFSFFSLFQCLVYDISKVQLNYLEGCGFVFEQLSSLIMQTVS